MVNQGKMVGAILRGDPPVCAWFLAFSPGEAGRYAKRDSSLRGDWGLSAESGADWLGDLY